MAGDPGASSNDELNNDKFRNGEIRDDQPSNDEPSSDDELGKALAGEARALRGAPSLAGDGPRVRRETDAGPTEDTMVTAWEIEQAEGLDPRLRNLQADEQHRP